MGRSPRTHRFWASDCTDPLAQLEIQRGARLFFPPEIIGAHVSASPNHQTHRVSSVDFRCVVAFAYHFGVELDPLELADDERGTLKGWIALHKRLRPILHGGRQFHLEPLDGRYVWGASTAETVVVVVAQGPQMMTEQPPPLRLPAEVVGGRAWRARNPHAQDTGFHSRGRRPTAAACWRSAIRRAKSRARRPAAANAPAAERVCDGDRPSRAEVIHDRRSLREVRKSFGGVEIIKGVDILIANSEFFRVRGSFGLRQSTLLGMIAGLEDITSGDLRIGGRDMKDVDSAERGIAKVLQSYALYPHMTVRENSLGCA